MKERAPPVSLLCYCHNHRGNSKQASCLRVREQHQVETAPSSASGLESHVFGCFQSSITSLCQQPSLGHPDAFMATDSRRLSVALVGKEILFFKKQQSDDL